MSFQACSSSAQGSAQPGDERMSLSDENLNLYEKKRWSDGGNIPTAVEGGLFQDIRFDYDSALVPAEVHEMVQRNADAMRADPSLRVEIEGHCDKRGTSEYNLALGAQRARAVEQLMINYGALPDQLSTVSYGEEIPIDPADNEAAYQKNRRVHFAVYRMKQ